MVTVASGDAGSKEPARRASRRDSGTRLLAEMPTALRKRAVSEQPSSMRMNTNTQEKFSRKSRIEADFACDESADNARVCELLFVVSLASILVPLLLVNFSHGPFWCRREYVSEGGASVPMPNFSKSHVILSDLLCV